ncbi:unnamed protein product [Caenorhabditis brenneri]
MILFLFWSSCVPFLLTICVSKKSQKSTREGSSEKSKRSRVAGSASVLASEKSERAVSSEKSVRKERNTAIDSLKVPRHSRPSKPSNSGKDLKQVSSRGGLGSETESQKTELIEVPLGKAARHDPSNNILTPISELKASSTSFQNQKVTFAHSLKRPKRRGTKPEDPDEKTAYIP